jgi:hypothetical protein
MDDVKLRKRKKATQFSPPPPSPPKKKKYRAAPKNTRVTRTGERILTASGSAPRSSKREHTVYKRDNDDFKNEVVGGWGGSSTRPRAKTKGGGTNVVKTSSKPKKAASLVNVTKSVVKQGQTWVSGSGGSLTKCMWDGAKKLTLFTIVDGVVVKEKVKEVRGWGNGGGENRFDSGNVQLN